MTTSSRSGISSVQVSTDGLARSATITRLLGASRSVVSRSRSPAKPPNVRDFPSLITVTKGPSFARSLRNTSVGPEEPWITVTSIQFPSSDRLTMGMSRRVYPSPKMATSSEGSVPIAW